MAQLIFWGRRMLLPVGIALALIVCGVVAYTVYSHFSATPTSPSELPEPGNPVYESYVRDFELGVAELDVDMGPQATASLSHAIDLIPQEPAGWANRGLVRMRSNGLKLAAGDLHQAGERAPNNAPIQALLGLLARKQGKFDEAVARYRKAVELNPGDPMARYALAQVIDQQGGPDSETDYQQQLDILLRSQRSNMFLLMELLSTATRRGDAAAFHRALAGLEKLAPVWGAQQRARLERVKELAAGGINARLVPEVIILGNVLREEPDFARSKRVIDPPVGTEGEPLRHFLVLESPPPSPAPPDVGMTFTARPLAVTPGVGKARWDLALPVSLTSEDRPIVFVANAHEVRRTDKAAQRLAFPGGAASTPPTAAGVLPIDWNNDFRTDLLCAGAGGLRFWQQDGNGTFGDVTAKTHLPETVVKDNYYGVWAADIDMDGDLDVIAAPRNGPARVLRNNSDGTFEVIEPFRGVADVRAFAWADLDNDGAPDAILLDVRRKVHVFMNERAGQFRIRPLPESVGECLAIAVADVNDDGVFDLVALRADGSLVSVSDQDKGRSWQVTELARWSDAPKELSTGSVQLHTADLDNNGSPDLIVAGPRAGQAWLSGERKLTSVAGVPPHVTAVVDLNGSGRLDLLALDDKAQPVRLKNRGTKAYHWQSVRPRANALARGDGRINSFAIGGEAQIRSGMLVSKQMIQGAEVHFGLGDRQRAEFVRILWPNGAAQVEFEPAPERFVTAQQRLKGSCPFLFGYDGHCMQFVKDFMWSTPLGMYINAQDPGGFVQTTEWIKIDGTRLAPHDGYYDVRVTAELWETDFFDLLKLVAVDHPADTEMFVDEAFPLVARPPQLHLTGPPRAIGRALDEHGRDVTDLVREVDGRYLDTIELGRYQGVARDHWVEVDLGEDAPRQGPVWLLATGWLHPTDSSINFALEQGHHERPRPLVLEVPDGKGGWRPARTHLGFPAGKNKTLMVRLDGISGPAVARHFRLRTNMEIYWDALRYAIGLDDRQARPHWLSAEHAQLRYRGFSRMTQVSRSSPEVPHYDEVNGGRQRWRDLIGYYTRYGDVRELLDQVDDRYVIMNAGDEIAMRFPVAPGPRAGWKRDFIWVSDGWTKDGDMNTRFSKTVLPLPAHNLTRYDRPPGRLEDDPVYERFTTDWQRYHTRFVRPDDFDQGLWPWHHN